METIGVFLTDEVADMHRKLLDFGVKGSDFEMLFFDGIKDSNLYICLYPFEDEDEEVRDEIIEVNPELKLNSVIGIDIGRSSNSWLACLKLITSFNKHGVLIDDSLGDFWTLDEINKRTKKRGNEFLASYIGNEEIERIWSKLA